MANTKHIAVCPRTGLHLRTATAAERAAYLTANNGLGSYAMPVRVGDVLVDEYTGPGTSIAGAGF